MPYAHSVAVTIVVVILTFLVGFRELLPKRIGLNHPIAKALPYEKMSVVTAVYLVVDQCTEFLLDILKIRPSSDGKITEEEIKHYKTRYGDRKVQEIEQDIVERVFTLG
jgi:putative hemolysin